MPRKCPLVLACSGCSCAGQLADQIARELDRRGIAEMTCLAGVGAAKPLFLRKLADREVWVIDGCPIECSLGVFAQVRQHVDVHIRLADFGIKKNAEPPQGDAWETLFQQIIQAATSSGSNARNTL